MTREEALAQVVEEAMLPLKDGFQIRDLWDMMTSIMENAEEWVGLTGGAEKKEFALEVLDTVLHNIDLPGPDFIARKVIMWLAPSIIDKLVTMTKRTYTFGPSTEEAA